MKLTIIGTGYVGLVTGTCFAEMGNRVYCVDNDLEKIANLKNNILPIYEPNLASLVKSNQKKGDLIFTTDLKEALDNSNIIFIAVGTPEHEDGSVNLDYVYDVASEIADVISQDSLIVIKSTVPVGTAFKVKKVIESNLNKDIKIDIASNPEFLKEGVAIADCMHPDRVIIGAQNDEVFETLKELYSSFIVNSDRFVLMDVKSAEMSKYVANALLATKISFMNEIANICEKVGANVKNVRLGIGSDKRIGYDFIYAGCGYGGSCFPKDVKALIKTAELNGYPMQVLRAVEEVNELQKSVLFDKLVKQFNDNLKDKTIALWGLAFKPETDDMREAPALVLIDKLLKAGCQIRAYDPAAMQECKRRIGDSVYYACDMYDAVLDADALMLVTEWKEFRLPSWAVIRKTMAQQIVLDGRNIYDKKEMEELGFVYSCIGK